MINYDKNLLGREILNEFINLKNLFFYFGLIWAIFFGWRATNIFEAKGEGEKKWDWQIYQAIFNGAGAFVGWIALYCIWNINCSNFEIKHLIILIIAFLGITGNLPYVARYGKITK
jgi:hypothetical protein